MSIVSDERVEELLEVERRVETMLAALRQIMTLAEQGEATEDTLNQIGHIADEALEHASTKEG